MELAVSFDPLWNYEQEDPHALGKSRRFTNAQGVEQGTCVHLGNCDIGCDVDAKNTLDRNYIPWAEKHGAEVRPLHIVNNIEPVAGGYAVSFNEIKGGVMRAGKVMGQKVIVAAGSLGSTELLMRCRDVTGSLPNISQFLGHNWSSNGDFLTPAFYPHRAAPISPTRGPTISSAIDFLDRSEYGQSFWIEDGGIPDMMNDLLRKYSDNPNASARAKMLIEELQKVAQGADPFSQVMPWFAQAVDAGDGTLRMKRPWWTLGFGAKKFTLDWDITRSQPAITAVVTMHKRLADATGGIPIVPPSWSLAKDLVTPHPLGGCNMGSTAANGVVNHAGQVFGYPNLYVADAAIIPEAIGVNPSRTIGALAERIASIMTKR